MLLRKAAMRLIAAPLFTAFAVISVGAGVAVTTAVYSLVRTMFLSGPGVDDPSRVVVLTVPRGGREQRETVSADDFADLRAGQRVLTHLAATTILYPAVGWSGYTEVLPAEAVDGDYFATLGVQARIGRTIQVGDTDAAARVAVISEELWRTRFSGDRGVIGRTLRIAGQSFEVIGVVPARYRGAFGSLRSTSVWIPLAAEPSAGRSPSALGSGTADDDRLLVFGRLSRGESPTRASAEIATIARRLDAVRPLRQGADTAAPARGWQLQTMAAEREDDTGDQRLGTIIVVLVAMVLVVACTNLANLVLARGAMRQGELAVRLAMGASRARLVREQLVESALLAALGGVAAYVIFLGVSALMTRDVMIMPAANQTLSIRPVLDAQAVAIAAAAMLLALLVFGLEPAVQLTRTLDIRGALAATATGIRPRVARQRLVIRWQVAVAAGFFIVATMFMRATLAQSRHDPGIDLDPLAVATVQVGGDGWDEERLRLTIERVMDEARREPRIEMLSVSSGLPFGVPPAQTVALALPDADLERALTRAQTPAIAVTSSAFATLGIAIVRGRAFTDADVVSAAPAVVLSELAATQLFGTIDVAGRSIALRRPPDAMQMATVVGVARDTDVGFINARRRPLAYLPIGTPQGMARLTLTARSTGRGVDAVAPLREIIRRSDPDLGVDVIGDGRRVLSGPFEIVRAAGTGTLYLGAFTLLLSMVGLFGVQSHVIASRTREIGVRMAMGATTAAVKRMVLADGYRPVLEGLLLGLWGGLAGRVMVRAYLDVDVAIVDGWMLLVTPVPLILAAFWACYLPAARAARVDPTVALRYE